MTETVSGPKKIVLLFAFACLLLTGASAMYYRGQAGAKVQVKRGGKMPATMMSAERSEERRVGKECRSRWSPYH